MAGPANGSGTPEVSAHRQLFPWIADFHRAQHLALRQLTTNWPAQLTRLYRFAQPALDDLLPGVRLAPYWTIEQSEWATDIAFHSANELAALQPSLLRHAMTSFHSSDVMRFLGRRSLAEGKFPPTFAKEVVTSMARRIEGIRCRHQVGYNAIKMYEKKGRLLRVETTINDASDLKVFRKPEGNPQAKRQYLPMRKGVADLRRRAELCQSANERYLDALAAADVSRPLSAFTDRLAARVEFEGRWFRALNPLGQDAALLAAVSLGDFLIKGFRNADIRRALYEKTRPGRKRVAARPASAG
jgi:hypothetical protein